MNNGENKSELVKAITDYYKSKSIRDMKEMPHEEKTWKVTNSQLNEDLSCNHVETDTRSLLEGRKSKHPVVITASDTDVLALMHYAHQQLFPQND